jgi:hypothetical protein
MARASDPALDAATPEPDDDDEALSWAGDDLRGGIDPLTRNRVSTTVEASADVVAEESRAPSSLARTAANVLFAILFLLVVVGWILSTQLTSAPSTDLFTEVAWQFGEFVAIISGALWFLTVLTLTVESRTRIRVGWFALGVAVLAPWPILLAAL